MESPWGPSDLGVKDRINIGIGGSDMGPKCVYNALRSLRLTAT